MRMGIVRFHVREVPNKWPFVFAQTTVLIFLVLVVTLYRAICEVKASKNICNNIQHLYKSYECNMYEYINILYKFMRSFEHSYIFI